MRREIIGLGVLLVLLLATAATATNVSGNIPTGTWTAAGNPYILVGNAAVPSGATLTIQSGVQVQSPSGYSLTVNSGGMLFATGANFTGPGTGSGVGLALYDSVTISSCSFQNYQYGLLLGDDARPVVSGTSVTGCTYPLLYSGGCRPHYQGGNSFTGNLNNEIALVGASYTPGLWGTEALADYRLLGQFLIRQYALSISSGVKIRGFGGSNRFYSAWYGSGGYPAIVASGVKFYASDGAVGNMVYIESSSGGASRFTDCEFIGTDKLATGLSVYGDSLTLSNCQFTGLQYGLNLGDDARPVVSGTSVTGCTYPLLYSGGCRPHYQGGNSFTGNLNNEIALVGASYTPGLWGTEALADYRLLGQFLIRQYALSISSGVKIRGFGGSNRFYSAWYGSGGYPAIVASGVKFYASDGAVGNMVYIESSSGGASRFTDCEFIGTDKLATGLSVYGDSLTLSNCQFTGLQYGLNLGDDARPVVSGTSVTGCTYPLLYSGGCRPHYQGGNSFTGNLNNEIALVGASYTPGLWGTEALADYRLLGQFLIRQYALSISSGVKIRGFGGSNRFYSAWYGSGGYPAIVASGVKFYASDGAVGNMVYIESSSGGASRFTDCEFIGTDKLATGLSVYGDSLTLSNCQFTGLQYGLNLGDDARPVVSGTSVTGCTYPLLYSGGCRPHYQGGNSFTGNLNNEIALVGASYTPGLWGTEALADYRLLGQFLIRQYALSISSGVKIRGFGGSNRFYSAWYGSGGYPAIVASGVKFYASDGAVGNMVYIESSSGGASRFTDCEFIGTDKLATGLSVYGDSLTLSNCQFTGLQYGLNLNSNARISLHTSEISSCVEGIHVNPSTSHVRAYISNCRIEGNSNLGALNSDALAYVDARYNWWGSPKGPRHSSNPLGDGDSVSNYVQFQPWLTEAPNVKGGLAGRVTEITSGNPIPGTSVVTTFGYSGITDNNGYYRIRLIPPGYGYEVTAYKSGFVQSTVVNVSISDAQPTEIDFQLSVSSISAFDLQTLIPNPNPNLSVIQPGGFLYRYYKLVDTDSEKPVPGVWVIFSDQDSAATDLTGMATIKISPVDVGNGLPGATRTYQITHVNSGGFRFPIQDPVSFDCKVISREYDKSFKTEAYAELGISWARVKGEGATIVSMQEYDAEMPNYERVKVNRQGKGKAGVGYDVSSPLQVDVMSAGFSAEAGIEVYGEVVSEDNYQISYPNYSDFDAFNMYLLWASGNEGLIDHALLRMMAFMESHFTGQSSLDASYQGDAKALGVGYEAHVEGSLGIHGATELTNIALGVGGAAHIEGNYFIRSEYEKGPDEVTVLLGATGEVSGEAWGIGKLSAFDGKVYSRELPFYVTPLSMGRSAKVGEGALLGAIFPADSPLDCRALTARYHWLQMIQNDYETIDSKYELTGADLLAEIYGRVPLISSLANSYNQSQSLNCDITDLFNVLLPVFETAYNVQQDAISTNGIDYEVRKSQGKQIGAGDLKIKFTPSGERTLKVKVGIGASFKEEDSWISEKGQWVLGRHLPLESYSTKPSIQSVDYTAFLQEMFDKVPLAVRVAAFLYQFFCPICKEGRSQNVFYITDSTGVDTTAYLTYKPSTFPPTAAEVGCAAWGWYGSSPTAKKSSLTPTQLAIHERIRDIAQESRGMRYGIGGFYQFEPLDLVLLDSAAFTITYADDELDGASESELAIYIEDKEQQNWVFIGGAVDSINNRVTAPITKLGAFTLAPRLPAGTIGLIPSPATIPSDSIAVSHVMSDTIRNNDGTVVADGTVFTVASDYGTFLTVDEDTTLAGLQVASSGGKISFDLLSSRYPTTSNVDVKSKYGKASGGTQVTFTNLGAPTAPTILSTKGLDRQIKVVWSRVHEIDVAGYKIYYDRDASGEPYTGKASIFGAPSPIDIGNDTSFVLSGLENDSTYYIAVRCYDVVSALSGYSNEKQVTPRAYVCGDADGSSEINIADAVYLVAYIFTHGPAPSPLEAGDADCSGDINIADCVYLINYIFLHGAAPCDACK